MHGDRPRCGGDFTKFATVEMRIGEAVAVFAVVFSEAEYGYDGNGAEESRCESGNTSTVESEFGASEVAVYQHVVANDVEDVGR